MSFRTVVVDTHSKLEYSLGYLVFRTSDGQDKRINLSEIQTLIVQSTAVALTSSLICELMKNNINVIFCDEKKNPHSQLLPIYGSYITYKKYTDQIGWTSEIKGKVWQEIVKEKLKGEHNHLIKKDKKDIARMIKGYLDEIEEDDATNREGHAAKVYFNNIFYPGFTRSDDSKTNIFLNYGYSIIASYISRTVVSLGYLTQLGIHHIGVDNEFNFTYDLIEPFRVFVDQYINKITDDNKFKDTLVGILAEYISFNGKKQTIATAISMYVQSVITSLNKGNIKHLSFPDNYEL